MSSIKAIKSAEGVLRELALKQRSCSPEPKGPLRTHCNETLIHWCYFSNEICTCSRRRDVIAALTSKLIQRRGPFIMSVWRSLCRVENRPRCAVNCDICCQIPIWGDRKAFPLRGFAQRRTRGRPVLKWARLTEKVVQTLKARIFVHVEHVLISRHES